MHKFLVEFGWTTVENKIMTHGEGFKSKYIYAHRYKIREFS